MRGKYEVFVAYGDAPLWGGTKTRVRELVAANELHCRSAA